MTVLDISLTLPSDRGDIGDNKSGHRRAILGDDSSRVTLRRDHDDSLGSDVELDVVGVCCEYEEGTPEYIAKQYNIDLEDDGNELLNVLDSLHDMTTVVGVTSTGSIVYEQF
jgi:hypothetical protein